MTRGAFFPTRLVSFQSWLLLAILTLAGCGSSAPKELKVAEGAKEALEKALTAWQGGGKPGDLATNAPPVEVHDSQWEGGQAIDGFTIVDEKANPGDTSKTFNVTLKLKGGKGETKTTYLVSGSDPITIYRDRDFAKLLNAGSEPKGKR